MCGAGVGGAGAAPPRGAARDPYLVYSGQHRRCTKKILSRVWLQLYEAEIEADPYSLYE
jgi:hypothetical protein